MSFFLRSLSDRCQLVTGTYKTNVSKFARKVFNYFQSFSSFTPLTGTTNFSDDILTMVKWNGHPLDPGQTIILARHSKLPNLPPFSEKANVWLKAVIVDTTFLLGTFLRPAYPFSISPFQQILYFPSFNGEQGYVKWQLKKLHNYLWQRWNCLILEIWTLSSLVLRTKCKRRQDIWNGKLWTVWTISESFVWQGRCPRSAGASFNFCQL